jgi:amidase
MARHAEDVDEALRALAGPDLLQRTAWQLKLPPPRRRRLTEFRVTVSPSCRIDTSPLGSDG